MVLYTSPSLFIAGLQLWSFFFFQTGNSIKVPHCTVGSEVLSLDNKTHLAFGYMRLDVCILFCIFTHAYGARVRMSALWASSEADAPNWNHYTINGNINFPSRDHSLARSHQRSQASQQRWHALKSKAGLLASRTSTATPSDRCAR